MNKLLLFIACFILTANACTSQQLSATDRIMLQKKEDSLKTFALDIIRGRNSDIRFKADSQFTKMFVRALKIKGSFYYPFDSLITISKLTPEDSTFRIFTWQLAINEDLVRQHGAIQMRTADGSLKLLPLIDKTDVIKNIEDTIANNFDWIGAVYYKIIEKKAFGKNYYTLLGYDENNINSNRKIIEVLTFKDGEPIFGGSFFSFQDNSLDKNSFARYIMEYKKNAGPRLTYDPEMDMIIYEHLISETGEPNKKYTYIPDGDYEGLKWRDGKWVHIQKVFTQKTPEGKEPVPLPIRDAQGNIDESKLSQRMPENAGSETPNDAKTVSPLAPEKKDN
ncbi:MAG: hypothetical protein Q8891_05140 [Bacteroidota bacterium]|jgi:hypothetical protein|nr:hypothetical protein [Bacteroidota bacterium]